MTTTISVATEAQLNQAIAQVDELNASGDFVIKLTADIKLGSDLNSSITYGGVTRSAPAELFALNLHNGVTVTIDGQGHKIDGSSSDGRFSYYRGLFVYSGEVAVQNLTIANTKATGGTGYDGGGGGAGLGAGLYLADDSANGAAPAHVTLSSVVFLNNNATGGSTVYSGDPHGSAGAGGGMGGIDGTFGGNGAARNGGGGVGSQSNGGGDGTPGGVGLILGAGSGGSGASNGAQSGAPGGAYGGGGGGTSYTNTSFVVESAGGGGGVGGQAAVSLTVGGAGGYGGGGGEKATGGFGGGGGEGGYGPDATAGGDGGFGGGGGGSNVQGGKGGFGAADGSSTLHYSGGSGLGAGGAIFVQQGASLTISGASSISGGSATPGGTLNATTAKAYGSGIFLQGNETITFSAGAGQTLTVSDDIADQSGSGGTGANAGVGAVIVSGSGTVALTGNNTFTGGVTVASGASFTGNAGSGGVSAGAGGVIRITTVDGLGNVTNLGSGRLTLNGGTLIDAAGGSATLSNALAIGGGGGALLPNGYYLGLTGGLTGSGALSLGTPGGSGTVVLDADESAFTGAITVQSGTTLSNGSNTVIAGQSALKLFGAAGLQLNGRDLAVGSLADGAAGSGGYVQNSGSTSATLTVGADGTDTTFSGTIGRAFGGGGSDAIALRKLGAGTLTLGGADVLPGGLRIDAGAVQIGDGSSSLGSVTGDIVDNGRLFYASGPFNVTASSAISGTGTLTKLGTGVLVLTGASSLSGLTTVYAGTLAEDGSLAGPVTVAAGAVLAGHGTVGDLTIQSGGRLAPGGTSGSTSLPPTAILNTGSLTLSGGATWTEKLNGYATGSYDALNVTGTVTLAGALNLTTTNGFSTVPVGTSFTLITNDGVDAVAGAFSNQNSAGDVLRSFTVSQTSSPTFYTYTQAYHVNVSGGDGNDVVLTMINTQPVIYSYPTGATVASGSSFAFNPANHARIDTADADEGASQTLTTTISVAHGTLTADGYFDGEGGSTLSLAGFSASSTDRHLGALVYTPTPGYVGSDTLTITVRDSSGASNDTMTQTVALTVAGTGTGNHAPSITGTHAASTSDRMPVNPFSGVAVTDPDTGQSETATISFTAANGTLSGAGAAAVANGVATYTVSAGSAQALTTALQAVSFTPVGAASTQTAFSLSVSDGTASTAVDTGTLVSATTTPSANTHAPVFSSGATASAPRNVGPATPVYTAHATDADGDTLTYAIAGGADAARFDIDAATGAVTFRTAPSYANPDDAGADHVYDIVVSASDGVAAHTASQAVAISLPDPSATPGATAAPPTIAPGQTVTIDASAPGVITGDVADGGVLQIAASASVGFSGSVSGTGSLVKAGAGVLTLSGVSTYTGTTSVTGGELVVDGSIAASAVVVGPGGILGGHGTTGSVTLQAGAGLSPGNSPGTLATGALTLGAGAVLNEEIGGVGAGGFDLLRVTGAVTLAGATLNTTLYGGFAAPTTSSPLVVIDNDGTDAVVGTFAGLAEGAVFALGGQQVRISYVGGTGNDVTLQFVSGAGGAGGGVVPAAPAPTPSQQAGYATLAGNLIRVAAGDPALGDPSSPLYAQVQAETAIAARLDAGQIGPADAQTALFHLVDATTSVAETSYAFFTGRTPTAAGLSYLVHSPANPTDLNDPYYAQFTTENRYINFGVNLATGQGAGAAAFQASYGALTLADATAKAYAAVFGFAPVAGKVDAILDAQVSNGLGGTETRAQYFADISGGGALAQKAAVAGFLLSDSVKEGFGAYQQADLHFLQDLAHGTATYNVDLLAAYGTAPTLVGQPVVDSTLGG